MSAIIENSSRHIFSDIESFVQKESEISGYNPSKENDGCMTFVYNGKTCTSRFYEPDLVEMNFDFREIKSDADLFDLLYILQKISRVVNSSIKLEAEGDRQPFAIVNSEGIDYKFH
jgi:hypothetical protein